MRNTRLWPLVFSVGVLAWRGAAVAAGFGSVGTGAVLGQPLDFTVPLRLEPGDSLAPECLSAEVTMGERRLAAGAVRTAFEMVAPDVARVRVRTLLSIDEPVVGVVVQAGCASRIARRFVLFADPPHLAQAAAAVNVAPAVDAAPEAPVAAAPALPKTAEAAPSAPPHAQPAAKPPRPARRAARSGPRPERVAAVRRAPAASARSAGPRLKLEAAETVAAAPAPAASSAVEEALQAVAQAASAAQAAASAASVANERIAGLERTVESLRGEARASRELAAQLRDRLARAEDAGRWTWPLLAAVLFLTALAAWLAWKLNSAQRQRQQSWAPVSAPAPRGPAIAPTTLAEVTPSKQPTAPIPFVTSELRVSETPRPRGSVPAWPPPAPTSEYGEAEVTRPLAPMPAAKTVAPEYPYDAAMARTQILPASAEPDAPPRDLTIEELIDLEQQAEFFVVLGQDEAAIDLLVEHLRHTGGSSPLPYLKLLEIYRRRGEREEYERTRVRFNQRFNAYAPDWDVDLTHGRTLESYPGVVPRLQQVWPRPLDAMAELEALLFRKSRGDLFELPAYRDVLMLYAMARDLLDREAVETGNVDLLLPLSDGGEFSSTTPAPYLGVERDSGFMPSGFDDRPTAPVDLDLTSGHDRPSSIFDTLDPLDERPRR